MSALIQQGYGTLLGCLRRSCCVADLKQDRVELLTYWGLPVGLHNQASKQVEYGLEEWLEAREFG